MTEKNTWISSTNTTALRATSIFEHTQSTDIIDLSIAWLFRDKVREQRAQGLDEETAKKNVTNLVARRGETRSHHPVWQIQAGYIDELTPYIYKAKQLRIDERKWVSSNNEEKYRSLGINASPDYMDMLLAGLFRAEVIKKSDLPIDDAKSQIARNFIRHIPTVQGNEVWQFHLDAASFIKGALAKAKENDSKEQEWITTTNRVKAIEFGIKRSTEFLDRICAKAFEEEVNIRIKQGIDRELAEIDVNETSLRKTIGRDGIDEHWQFHQDFIPALEKYFIDDRTAWFSVQDYVDLTNRSVFQVRNRLAKLRTEIGDVLQGAGFDNTVTGKVIESHVAAVVSSGELKRPPTRVNPEFIEYIGQGRPLDEEQKKSLINQATEISRK